MPFKKIGTAMTRMAVTLIVVFLVFQLFSTVPGQAFTMRHGHRYDRRSHHHGHLIGEAYAPDEPVAPVTAFEKFANEPLEARRTTRTRVTPYPMPPQPWPPNSLEAATQSVPIHDAAAKISNGKSLDQDLKPVEARSVTKKARDLVDTSNGYFIFACDSWVNQNPLMFFMACLGFFLVSLLWNLFIQAAEMRGKYLLANPPKDVINPDPKAPSANDPPPDYRSDPSHRRPIGSGDSRDERGTREKVKADAIDPTKARKTSRSGGGSRNNETSGSRGTSSSQAAALLGKEH